MLNNAGIGIAGPFMDTDWDDWRRIIDINLMGVVHGSRLFGRAMIDSGLGGQIVNTASAAAFQPTIDLPAYATSKAAVLMLSECLRAELARVRDRGHRGMPRGDRDQHHPRDRVRREARGRPGAAARAGDRGSTSGATSPPSRWRPRSCEAIGADRPIAVVTPEAKAMRLLSRFAPALLRRLARVEALPG